MILGGRLSDLGGRGMTDNEVAEVSSNTRLDFEHCQRDNAEHRL